jgi:hypothetical protein
LSEASFRVDRQIVVAFRMPPAGLLPGPEGPYLSRARSICARGEALGGRLVAWSAALLAMAWDTDSIEEAFELATSLREESSAADRAWTCGIAEGELESLAPDGQRMHLAWGEALRAAASLARVAKAGEVLVDGDVRALRAGQLALIGARSATDAGQRVRGWRLDLEHPWKRGAAGAEFRDDSDATINVTADDLEVVDPGHADATQPMPVADFADFSDEELSTSDVLQVIEAASLERESFHDEPATSARRREGTLADRVRALSRHDRNRDPVLAIADLRRARARAHDAPPTVRCQASLALALALSIAGRVEEGLLEALDALASARVAQDPKAVNASIALLSKLYAGAGFPDAARTLRECAASADGSGDRADESGR